MSREESARAAVQALVPDDEILDVALVYPRGTTRSEAAGMAVGGVASMGSGFQGVGMVVGSMAGGKIFSDREGPALRRSCWPSPLPTVYVARPRHAAPPSAAATSSSPCSSSTAVQAPRRAQPDPRRPSTSTLVDTEHDATLDLEARAPRQPRREGAAGVVDAFRRAPGEREGHRLGVTAGPSIGSPAGAGDPKVIRGNAQAQGTRVPRGADRALCLVCPGVRPGAPVPAQPMSMCGSPCLSSGRPTGGPDQVGRGGGLPAPRVSFRRGVRAHTVEPARSARPRAGQDA